MAAPTIVEVLSDEASGSGIQASITTASGTAVNDILLVIVTDNYYTGYNNPIEWSGGLTSFTHIVLADNAGSGNRSKINA